MICAAEGFSQILVFNEIGRAVGAGEKALDLINLYWP